MATLNSTSTLTEIEAAYADNASYVEDDSIFKARIFITACRLLIRLYPKMTSSGQQQMHLNPELLQNEIESATDWLVANDANSTLTTRTSFENFKLW